MTRALAVLAALVPIVAVLAIVAWSVPAMTVPAKGWTDFATLGQPRAFAEAVALPTGEILVVGGLDKSDPLVTNPKTELVDPLGHKTQILTQEVVGRLHQTATLAAGERVVQAGGVVWSVDHWTPVARVDVYDVKTRQWRPAAPLHDARSDHAAVALKDGRVMVIGGNFDTRLLSSVEIYDPRTDVWTKAASLPRPRTQHAAVRLADGRILVAGGIDTDGGATDSTFIYDPSANTWSDGPRMREARLQESVVMLPSGDVLFVGGNGASAGSSELYLAAEERFGPSGALAHPRFVAQAAALPDGRVVVNGGLPPRSDGFAPLSSTEIWDPATRTWSEAPPASSARAWAKLLWVGGAMFLISGSGADEDAQGSVERLTFE
jgi:large repetitive protein